LSSQPVILAVDAGNTRVKWALHDGHAFVRDGRRALADASAIERDWALLPAPDRIVVASVAGESVRSVLVRAARRWDRDPLFVAGTPRQCGVSSRYLDPAQLGPDRWAALIAARALGGHAQLVVCAGTATTIDCLLADGTFAGGLIVPGFDLMHDALASNTAQLTPEHGEFRDFPQQTKDAITSGAIHAICGAIERMRALMLANAGAEPAIVATGGAAQLVARHLGRPVQVRDKLILEGLVRIAGEAR
jgi:type III pantothenate kinase